MTRLKQSNGRLSVDNDETMEKMIPDNERGEDKEKGWPKVIYWVSQGQGFIVWGIPLDCDRWDNVP